MDARVKEAAVLHVLEETKERNYRREMSPHRMRIIVGDIIDTLEKWEGPRREGK